MTWLIGASPRSVNLIDAYWSSDNPVRPLFLPFMKRNDSPFLTPKECKKLHSLTFLDVSRPFGLIDLYAQSGMVAFDSAFCKTFEKCVSDALDLVCSVPTMQALISKAVRRFIPLAAPSIQHPLREDGSGKSAHWLKGGIFLSLPEDSKQSKLNLALNIVHELGHQVLMIFQDCDSIVIDIKQPVYSVIRKVDRPAILSFHALIATYFMLHFANALKERSHLITLEEYRFLIKKLNCLKKNFVAGAFALKHVDFTPLGLILMDEMTAFAKNILEQAA